MDTDYDDRDPSTQRRLAFSLQKSNGIAISSIGFVDRQFCCHTTSYSQRMTSWAKVHGPI
jgi:hypothetical protein